MPRKPLSLFSTNTVSCENPKMLREVVAPTATLFSIGIRIFNAFRELENRGGANVQWGAKSLSPPPYFLHARRVQMHFSFQTHLFSGFIHTTTTEMHIPNTEYSPHIRGRIVAGYDLGLIRKALFAKEDVNPKSVFPIIKRYQNQNKGQSKPRSGRPRKLTKRDIRLILRLVNTNPFIPNKQLVRNAGLNCLVRTLSRELVRRGIQHEHALKRPKLSTKHARKRLIFTKLHVRKPLSW